MADTLLDVLADARTALLDLGPPVKIAGDPDPGGDEVLVLEAVADTRVPSYRTEASTKRIQVTCYAATLQRTLELTDAARAALASVGLRWIASRPAPDPEKIGTLSEYRR